MLQAEALGLPLDSVPTCDGVMRSATATAILMLTAPAWLLEPYVALCRRHKLDRLRIDREKTVEAPCHAFTLACRKTSQFAGKTGR